MLWRLLLLLGSVSASSLSVAMWNILQRGESMSQFSSFPMTAEEFPTISCWISKSFGLSTQSAIFTTTMASGESVMELPIPLPIKSPMYSLMSGFAAYFRSRRIIAAPKILITSFDRQQGASKSLVYYPEYMDLSKMAGNGQGVYKLLGVLHDLDEAGFAAQFPSHPRMITLDGNFRDVAPSESSVVALVYEQTTRGLKPPGTESTTMASPSVTPRYHSVTSTRAPMDPTTTSVSTSVGTPVPPGLRGIVNLGSTCYLNTALQVLSHSRCIRSILSPIASNPLTESEPNLTDKQIVNAFARHVDHQWGPDGTVIEPAELVAVLRAAPLGKCEDVSKVTTKLLGALGAVGIGTEMFVSVFRKRMTCQSCSVESVVNEPVTSLELPLNPSALQVTLKQSITALLEPETVLGADCESCTTQQEKRFVYEVYPAPLLLLNIKRLGAGGAKNPTWITFPLEFDSSELFGAPTPSHRYSLIGIIHHLGNHYFCDYRFDGNWYRANDVEVTPYASHKRPHLFGASQTALIYERLDI